MSVSFASSGPAIFDADGFLIDPAMWSESLADRIAQNDGLGELSELQIGLLLALRREYAKHGTVMHSAMSATSPGRAQTACSTCSPIRARHGGSRACPIRARKPKPICKHSSDATMAG